jgi:hypothetical protein
MSRNTMLLTTCAALLAVAACDSPTGTPGSARLTVLLTDAPHQYLESAVVTIGEVALLRADGGPVVVTAEGGSFDLLQLQDGVTASLGSETIDAGRYLQARLKVTDATLTLKAPYTFVDGTTSRTLQVPSGASSGIKINLRSGAQSSDGVEIRAGETTLVVDFDVSQNFVMQGDADSHAGIHGFLFTPLLRAVVEDVAGSIAGSVSAPDGVVTEGLSVTATRTDAGLGDIPATTLVKEDGTFKLHFLPPGTYDVTIAESPPGHAATTVQRTVGNAEHVTGVELVLTPG